MIPFAIERIDVGGASLTALVRVPEGVPMRTSQFSGVTDRALGLLPGLRRHTCENGTPRGMARELGDTETPHLLEHVAFELMALSGSPRTLHGNTEWDFSRDGRGVFWVTLEFDDDLVALAALQEGVPIVSWLLEPGDSAAPVVDAVVARLVEVRRGASSGGPA